MRSKLLGIVLGAVVACVVIALPSAVASSVSGVTENSISVVFDGLKCGTSYAVTATGGGATQTLNQATNACPRPRVASESIVPDSIISGTVDWTVTTTGDAASVEFWVEGTKHVVSGSSPFHYSLDTTTLTNTSHGFGIGLVDSSGVAYEDYPDFTATVNNAPPPPPSPIYSADRFVWCLGDPNWNNNNSLSPGWWGNFPTWNGSTSSTGWIRDSAGANAITPQRIYYDDSAYPNLMSGISGSYGAAGTSGPCKTVVVRVNTNDPQTPGINNPSQGSVVRLDPSGNDQNPFYGQRPTSFPKPGQTWYYGFAAATNSQYVPHYDSAFGNWNSFGLEFHASNGLLGPVMQEINTLRYPTGTAGPNGAITYTCQQTQNGTTRLITPRLQLALTAGTNNATTNDSTHTCLRVQGPDFHSGQVYKTIYVVKWDAFQHGSLKWYVDSGDGRGYVLYADLANVSTLWHDTSNNVDQNTYPQLLNYRKFDNTIPDAIMYYGGFVRGSTMADVTLP